MYIYKPKGAYAHLPTVHKVRVKERSRTRMVHVTFVVIFTVEVYSNCRVSPAIVDIS